MFDRLIRYLPALDYIRKYKPQKILEVGSGPRGLGEFYDSEFTGCDLALDENPVHNMTFVQCSASKLPFYDREFDLVICMDVMEHVRVEEREQILREMWRVVFGRMVKNSRVARENHRTVRTVEPYRHAAVIIGFPCGVGAEKLSKKMFSWFEARRSGTARWMKEHVENGLPEEKWFKSNLLTIEPYSHRAIKELNNENLRVCEWLLKLEDFPRFLKLEKILFAHFRLLVEFFLRRLSFGKCYRKIWILRNYA